MIFMVIVILCADIYTTWYLLSNYGKRVKEVGLLGKSLFRMGFYGHSIFVAIRIAIVFLVIEYTGDGGMAAWGVITAFAVVNNLLVIRRLKRGSIHLS
jgi:hypothetical protein